jgi:hypothetical protein
MAEPELAAFTPTSLGAVFGEAEPEVDADPADVAEGADGADEKPAKAETKEKAPTGEKEDGAPPSTENKEGQTVPLAAMLAERDKRKQIEAELTALKGGKDGDGGQKKPKDPELPSIYEGEGQYNKALLSTVQSTVNRAIFVERFNLSRGRAIKEHGEEAVQQALDRVTPEMEKNQKLAQRFRNSMEPLVEVVEMARELETAEKLSDPNYVKNWEAERETEIRKKVLQELQDAEAGERALDDAIPDSLSGSGSKGGLKAGRPFTGPTPLAEILK